MLDVRLPDFNFAISLYVWFRDLDAMGHVNNAVYLQFFEQARSRYWLSLLSGESPSAGLSHPPSQHVDEHAFQKINFIVAHAECDYVTPARMGESLLVGCRISEIGRSSFTFEYRIEALTLRELRHYLAHRLQVAGYQGGHVFSTAAAW